MGHRTGLLTPPGEGLCPCLETVRGRACLSLAAYLELVDEAEEGGQQVVEARQQPGAPRGRLLPQLSGRQTRTGRQLQPRVGHHLVHSPGHLWRYLQRPSDLLVVPGQLLAHLTGPCSSVSIIHTRLVQ